MKTLLYIKANPKPDNMSRTFQISEKFIESYKNTNPEDEIITLDLYKEKINYLSSQEVMQHSAAEQHSGESNMMNYARQFAGADRYVFAAPLWNLGIPAILKSYFDYVTVKNISFKYTEKGPVGLLQNKKAILITTRGGIYDKAPMSEFEMGERYVRTILGFLGISEYACVHADGTDIIGADVKKIVNAASDAAVELSKTF